MTFGATFEAATTRRSSPASAGVRAWLWIVAGLVFIMIVVGGATRLTQSGLAITEWQPIVGTLPPMTDKAWIDAFEKYKLIPQYQVLNKGMALAEFKVIYWWEWAHRLLGRLIGLALLIPFAWLLARGYLTGRLALRTGVLTVLVGLQGAMGWFMVRSGLAARTDVSQYRLALHLTLALIIFAGLVATVLDLAPRRGDHHLRTIGCGQKRVARGLVVLILAQGFLGALVAGMKAGLAHNTWPLMNGALIPPGLAAISPWYLNPFENALTVQFDHRMVAYLIGSVALVHGWRVVRTADDPRIRCSARLLGLAVLAQIALGIWTLLAHVPLALGLAHQAAAAALLAIAVWHAHAIGREDG